MRLKRLLGTHKYISGLVSILVLVISFVGVQAAFAAAPPPENPQSGSTGVQGKISSPPPSVAATISLPRDGQSFSTLPVTVTGLCPKDTLVKIFKNNVFSGSVQCTNGSFSIQIDLFDGRNELIARVYDALDQAGPDSSTVTVNFDDNKAGTASRVSLTSNYAKRGANPGSILTWPIVLSGGIGPYALSIDWGDGKSPDLKSQAFPGALDITHTYDSPGVYNIVIKATDSNGGVAYLQLVGIANGPLSQDSTNGTNKNGGSNSDSSTTKTKVLWQPAAILLPLIGAGFWLGGRHQMHTLRKKIERGDRPF